MTLSFVVVGAGVNLILDCIGESYYEQNVNSIAMEGRWVVYGLLGKIKYVLSIPIETTDLPSCHKPCFLH